MLLFFNKIIFGANLKGVNITPFAPSCKIIHTKLLDVFVIFLKISKPTCFISDPIEITHFFLGCLL